LHIFHQLAFGYHFFTVEALSILMGDALGCTELECWEMSKLIVTYPPLASAVIDST
jgi:hypothetical protein